MNEITLDVCDFSLEQTLECGQCFRFRKVDDRSYTMIAEHTPVLLTFEPAGGVEPANEAESSVGTDDAGGTDAAGSEGDPYSGRLTIKSYGGGTSPASDVSVWREYFDLDRDYAAIKERLSDGDKVMQAAAKAGGGIHILKQDLWETIISFLISQNNNIPRIKGCIERLCALCGEPLYSEESSTCSEASEGGSDCESPEIFGDLSMCDIPTAEKLAAMSEDDLAPVRLGYRAHYIIETARSVASDGLPETYDELLSLCGVGPKVADCIRLFGLGETGSFPVDVWMKRVMHDMYGFDENDMKGMQTFAEEHYGKDSGFAQQYLYYYIRDQK
ncbi:MAG: DNA glycosylase [Eubacterium sp.]|jgi:N-glycosylase/DNA lyase